MNRVISSVRVVLFWAIVGVVVYSIILTLISLISDSREISISGSLWNIIGSALSLFPAVVLSVILGPFCIKRGFRNFAFIGIPVIIGIAGIILFKYANVECEGFGCLGKGLVLTLFANFLTIGMSLLPLAFACRKAEMFDFKGLFSKSLKPGLIITILFLLFNFVFLSPTLLRGMVEKGIEQDATTKLKNSFTLLKPSYLPPNVRNDVRYKIPEEKVYGGYIRFVSVCQGTYFTIEERPLTNAVHRISELETIKKDAPPAAAAEDIYFTGVLWINRDTLIESVVIGNMKGYYLVSWNRSGVQSTPGTLNYLIWETSDALMSIGTALGCASKDELIKTAESMKSVEE